MAACNYVAQGVYVDYTPGGAITAGDVVVQVSLIGIATSDIAANALGALAVSGIFDCPKAATSGTAIPLGTIVYWDDTNDVITASSGGNILMGKTVEVSVDADTYQKVRLDQ